MFVSSRRRAFYGRVFASVVVGTSALVLVPAPAGASTVEVALSALDGTAPFDADNAAGNDSSAENNRVRTNDIIGYGVEVSVNDANDTNVTFRLQLPRGVEATEVPAYCAGPGSSLAPTILPMAPTPITATSFLSLPRQTLVCNVGSRDVGSTVIYRVNARVRGEVPNGTVLDDVVSVAWSDARPLPSGDPGLQQSQPISTTVSARPKVDLSTNGYGSSPNSGYYQPVAIVRDGVPGYRMAHPIIATIQGGRGSAPLAEPITFTDDLGSSLYQPPLSPSAVFDPARHGAVLLGCYTTPSWSIPAPSGGSPSTVDAVANSGTWSCAQASPGQAVSVSITGADTTGNVAPTKARPEASASIPAGTRTVLAGRIEFFIPATALQELGLEPLPNYRDLQVSHRLTNFAPVGLDGTPNAPEANAAFNDSRAYTLTIRPRGAAGTAIGGLPGDPLSTPADDFSPSFPFLEGVPGQVRVLSGDGTVLPGQKFLIRGYIANNTMLDRDTNVAICSSIDTSVSNLTTIPGSYTSSPYSSVGSGGAPAWVSYLGKSVGSPTTRIPADYQFEYGTGPSGRGMTCDDDDSPTGWTTDPADPVHGNTSDLVSQGRFDKITKVRMTGTVSGLGYGTTSVYYSIGLVALPNPVGTIIATHRPFRRWFVGDPTPAWTLDAYDSVVHTASATGDRVKVAEAIVRIEKETVPVEQLTVLAGLPVTYRLRPTLTTGVASSGTSHVTVTDTLPPTMTYVLGSADPEPSSVVVNGDGTTTLVWNLGPRQHNADLPVVIFQARTLHTTVPDGADVVNTVVVSSPSDASDEAQRRATKTLRISNPAGLKVEKIAMTPLVEIGDDIEFEFSYVNYNSSALTDPEFIDVFPYNGDGRLTPTSYNGSLTFSSVGSSDPDAHLDAFDFTKRTPGEVAADPADPSNGTAGSTTWCTGDFGSMTVVSGVGTAADCPTTAAEATAMRMRRSAPLAPNEHRRYRMVFGASGNITGDMYTNAVSGRANGHLLRVESPEAVVRVVSASIGDRVWRDIDGDGWQDAGEIGIEAVPLELTGWSFGANAVDDGGAGDDIVIAPRDTTSGADGHYLFGELRAGRYSVRVVTPPSGLAASYDAPDNPGPTIAGDHLTVQTLARGEAFRFADFGYAPASVRGTVYSDVNDNGQQDSGELGIADVVLELTGRDDAGVTVARSTTSGPDGRYVFDDLPPSDASGYAVSETQPASFADGRDRIGSIGTKTVGTVAATDDDRISSIVVGAAEHGVGYDFGEIAFASVSGRVYVDRNRDGIDSGEEPIAGVSVSLTGVDHRGASVARTVATGSDGGYVFAGLRPGTYRIEETQPAQWADGIDSLGDAGGVLANDVVSSLTLTAGQTAAGYNFGEVPTVLAGTVWVDANRNQRLEPWEPQRLGGVPITVFDHLGEPVASGVTSTDGTYRFEVKIGTYRVVQTVQPAGYVSTTADSVEVDVPVEGRVDVDFGEVPAGSLGDRVWRDDNFDGVQDASEPDIAGATVRLTLPSGEARTVVTDSAGNYLFSWLPPGTYRVDIAAVPTATLTATTPMQIDVALALGEVFLGADFGFADLEVVEQTGRKLPATGTPHTRSLVAIAGWFIAVGVILVGTSMRRRR